jgi:hypothetical protein
MEPVDCLLGGLDPLPDAAEANQGLITVLLLVQMMYQLHQSPTLVCRGLIVVVFIQVRSSPISLVFATSQRISLSRIFVFAARLATLTSDHGHRDYGAVQAQHWRLHQPQP